MDAHSFFMGLITGLSCVLCIPLGWAWRDWKRKQLDEDEMFLMGAARAAGGRLVFRSDPAAASTTILQLKAFPDHPPLKNRQQVDRLVAKGYLELDKFGIPERFLLTSKGWARVKQLPPMALTVSHQGNWYNSISRRPLRGGKRKDA